MSVHTGLHDVRATLDAAAAQGVSAAAMRRYDCAEEGLAVFVAHVAGTVLPRRMLVSLDTGAAFGCRVAGRSLISLELAGEVEVREAPEAVADALHGAFVGAREITVTWQPDRGEAAPGIPAERLAEVLGLPSTHAPGARDRLAKLLEAAGDAVICALHLAPEVPIRGRASDLAALAVRLKGWERRARVVGPRGLLVLAAADPAAPLLALLVHDDAAAAALVLPGAGPQVARLYADTVPG